MTIVDKIVQHLGSLPESAQAEVLDFVEYLKFKEGHKGEDYEFILRGIRFLRQKEISLRDK